MKLNSLDDIDIEILDILQGDADVSDKHLAKRVGLSPSSVLARLRRLKKEGVIRRYVAILDEEKLQKSTVAYVFVTLSRHDVKIAQSFVKKIRENPFVMECSHITGKADYLLRVVARDIPQYREILMGRIVPMAEIESVQTWFVLKTEKRETRLPIRDELPDAKGGKK
jgi:Lrp/AsnC family leucine-responsive transcriptional regulator